jgi:hypothetical protein
LGKLKKETQLIIGVSNLNWVDSSVSVSLVLRFIMNARADEHDDENPCQIKLAPPLLQQQLL